MWKNYIIMQCWKPRNQLLILYTTYLFTEEIGYKYSFFWGNYCAFFSSILALQHSTVLISVNSMIILIILILFCFPKYTLKSVENRFKQLTNVIYQILYFKKLYNVICTAKNLKKIQRWVKLVDEKKSTIWNVFVGILGIQVG